MEKRSFIDLFCGVGGFRQALESHGHGCVFSSDVDPDGFAELDAHCRAHDAAHLISFASADCASDTAAISSANCLADLVANYAAVK